MTKNDIAMNSEKARSILGVSADAADEQIRAAYLEKVRAFPPDKHPDEFEKIRDAYDQLKDPRTRAMQVLNAPDPCEPITNILIGFNPNRRFAGQKLWMDALREKMKETRS